MDVQEGGVSMTSGAKRILIIDDDAVTREILNEALEPEGYLLENASNGRDGLELYRKAPFDLVITDIVMPEMEGLEMIRTFTRMYTPVPKIIAISGGGHMGTSGYLYAAAKLGAHFTFQKPFSVEEIVSTVHRLLK
jgi:CheY-like chemotaxis protein